jgi:hypothetical protein
MQTVEEVKSLPEKESKSQRKFAIGAIVMLWISLIVAFIVIGLPKTKNEFAKQNAQKDSVHSSPSQMISTTDKMNVEKDTSPAVQLNTSKSGSTDLVFYSKKAFLKYFINEYTEADLNKSLAIAKIDNKNPNIEKEKKVVLKVVRKKSIADKKEFSSDFEIKAVPNK